MYTDSFGHSDSLARILPQPFESAASLKSQSTTPTGSGSILDIRSQTGDDLSSSVEHLMGNVVHPQVLPGMDGSLAQLHQMSPLYPKIRSIPPVFLYNDKGLELFDKITYHPDYYLTRTELEIWEQQMDEMVKRIPNTANIIELGCGSLRKTKLLLDALDVAHQVTYYAVDINEISLRQCLESLDTYSNLKVVGLLGTYDDAIQYMQSIEMPAIPKVILWIGSSIGNMTAKEAESFVHTIQDVAMVSGDQLWIGMDCRKDPEVISRAYSDVGGLAESFTLNILHHANHLLGKDHFPVDDFKFVSRYNEVEGRHEAYLCAKKPVEFVWENNGTSYPVSLHKDELIHVEFSHKYDMASVLALAHNTRLRLEATWYDQRRYYGFHLFGKAGFSISSRQTPTSLPTLAEFEELWKVWDMLTTEILPTEHLMDKPIDLRQPFLFYLGHIPAFLDIRFSAATGVDRMDPTTYAVWFERGIDPDLNDPTKCHDHSSVPSYPTLRDILSYRNRVRDRVLKWYRSGETTRRIERHLWMAFEHEAMHAETFLYMLLQMKPGTLHVPKGYETWVPQPMPDMDEAAWLKYQGGSIDLGLDDPENEDGGSNQIASFGWDNEGPMQTVYVSGFQIQSRPVTNTEYLAFFLDMNEASQWMPASWIKLATGFGVRTIIGTPELSTEAGAWPVVCNLVQAMEYARWKKARIATEAEWTYASRHYHLRVKSEKASEYIDDNQLLPDSAFDAIPSHANVGFQGWCPHPFHPDERVKALGIPPAKFVGDAFEWTSSPFAPFDGFRSSELYPGYSADFFDVSGGVTPATQNAVIEPTTHVVIKGGSYATHERMAARHTFRNWYQAGYPYMLATFRLAH